MCSGMGKIIRAVPGVVKVKSEKFRYICSMLWQATAFCKDQYALLGDIIEEYRALKFRIIRAPL